jgi:mannitol operon transcriptional antiterminator
MLAERIKKEFKNINIVEVYASTNINDEWLKRNDIDVILSTVFFENDMVPVINVNPLLLENDIAKINQKLGSINILRTPKDIAEENFYEKMQHMNMYSDAIIELLDHMKIVSNLNFSSKEEMIRYISKEFTNDDQTLFEEFYQREEIGEIIFDDEHVVFLHTRSEVVTNICVGIFRNKTMIFENNHQYDTALVLIAPKEVSKEKLEILGEISAQVVNEDHFLNDLRYQTEVNLYKKIQKFLHRFFDKKIK